ncbi:Peptidase A1 domain-containing protein [Aphelenchoides fujianensis]|nr:Peptidase A1 domain-containing protein [Aphelenchoides fujianensis]
MGSSTTLLVLLLVLFVVVEGARPARQHRAHRNVHKSRVVPHKTRHAHKPVHHKAVHHQARHAHKSRRATQHKRPAAAVHRAPVPQQAAFNAPKTTAGSFEMQLFNYFDVFYRANVQVGTPPQSFDPVFHTGCILTRFPKKGCTTTGRFKETSCVKGTYDPSSSSTAQRAGTFDMPESEFTSFGASGDNYTEVMYLGQSRVKLAQPIGAITKMWRFDSPAFCTAPSLSWFKSSFREMVDQGLLSEPVMSVALKKSSKDGNGEHGGVATFGKLDQQNCRPLNAWTTAVRGEWKWIVPMKSLVVNGVRMNYNAGSAALNTGNSYINLPSALMRQVQSRLGLEQRGAFWTLDCKSTFTLEFGIDQQTPIRVTEKHLLLNQQVAGRCVVALAERRDNLVILGAAFHRAVCVHHNLRTMQVGFSANNF